MKVLIINIDSVSFNFTSKQISNAPPNIALEKIAKYHTGKGDEVIRDFPLAKTFVDKIYVSCIFTKNKHLCDEWEGIAEIGGTGYDIKKKLPDEIESIELRINYGFTTRGCIRKCKFCFVPEKEGGMHIVADLYDIWDGKSKEVIFFDNNILALPKHFKLICKQARGNNLRIDFNQGLDIRLLTDDIAQEIKKTRMSIRFAFDSPKTKSIIESKMLILHKYNIYAMWYILVGFDSDIEEEISRVEYLISHNQRPYIMKHENCGNDKRYIAIDRWANSPLFGKGTIPFKEYLNNTEDGNKYLKYFSSDYTKTKCVKGKTI